MSHTSLHFFHRLILEHLLLVCWIRSSVIVFSYDQVASIDIHYLEIAFDQSFLVYEQATSVESR
jgi:hypothetical protein